MTANAARNAYANSKQQTSSPRAIEQQVLSRITGALIAADRDKQDDRAGFMRAVSKNLEFWSVIATCVADASNALPPPLRAQIFYLFEFTRAHTARLFDGDPAATTDILVEINRNIIAGLKGEPETGAS